MNENPPLTAAALITAADAVRTAAAREDALARQAATGDQIRKFAEAVAKLGFEPEGPITYTNRAARRARARAERKH